MKKAPREVVVDGVRYVREEKKADAPHHIYQNGYLYVRADKLAQLPLFYPSGGTVAQPWESAPWTARPWESAPWTSTPIWTTTDRTWITNGEVDAT